MARLTREQYLERLKKVIGEDTSDEALSLLEDFTDTYDELETLSSDSTNWKEKYEQNNKEWQQKYKDRFFSGGETNNQNEETSLNNEYNNEEPTMYSDLFAESEV